MLKQEKRKKWSEASVIEALRPFILKDGRLPTNNYLRELGRNDLACAISKRGGWKYFSEKLSVPLTASDTVTGWEAENMAKKILEEKGFLVEAQKTKQHFDLLVNKCLRIDVKGTSFAEYGPTKGWFYRMGKTITADLVMCVRMDVIDFYIFPWFASNETNLTISQTGKAHAYYHNNLDILNTFLAARTKEFESYSRK